LTLIPDASHGPSSTTATALRRAPPTHRRAAAAIIQWYQGLLRFYTFNGYWNAGNILSAGAGNLLSAWQYGNPGAVFDQGNVPSSGSHFHFNAWQMSGKYALIAQEDGVHGAYNGVPGGAGC
jgi:hypothetical protein